MRRQHEWLSISDAGAERENVTYGVPPNVRQARLLEELRHTEPSGLFAERRRRDLGETNLVGERLVVRCEDVLVRRSDVLPLQ